MVPVFVVVILAVLLGVAIIAFIISRVDSAHGIRDYKQEKSKWIQRRDREVEDNTRLSKTLIGLARLLPKQYEILSGPYYNPYSSGWDTELIEGLANRKDNKTTNKSYDKIIEKLGALGK